MPSDYEIGRVVMVDTANVTIQLNDDLKALTKAAFEGVQDVARINSYVIIPVGARRLIAIVTRVRLTEDAELLSDRASIALPTARRLVNAVLVGTIDSEVYTQGISVFPALDSSVCMVSQDDLNTIFDHKADTSADHNNEDPGYCITVGESSVFTGFNIRIHPDRAFGKHLAVLGSTGSGKSCTVASIIQSVLSQPSVRQTNFIILDTNGEYRSAFQQQNRDETWSDIGSSKCLYIPSDPNEATTRLKIPYWFLNSDDFVRLFRATPGIQRPVLLDALRLARTPASEGGQAAMLRQILLQDLYALLAKADDRNKGASAEVENFANGAAQLLNMDEPATTDLFVADRGTAFRESMTTIAAHARSFVSEPDGRRFSRPIQPNIREIIKKLAQAQIDHLVGTALDKSLQSASPDQPLYFTKTGFLKDSIQKAMHGDEMGNARAADYCGTMLMRMHRLLEDKRFDFLFGPVGTEYPNPAHVLATFIRDILGLPSWEHAGTRLSGPAVASQEQLPFYDRQRNTKPDHNVVIIDLSLLASEVLENVTALIGRLVLEFLQRLGEYEGSKSRGAIPVVLVLEEAQNYIRETRQGEEELISRSIFERIAREGRKFGLGLIIASQRPSELSKTVLSQCSSFIVHRLQNPEDLKYFQQIVPGVYEPLLKQLPALAPQTALILGECVKAPALVKIRDAKPLPRSKDPKFYEYWVNQNPHRADVEAICARWEGVATTEQTTVTVQNGANTTKGTDNDRSLAHDET